MIEFCLDDLQRLQFSFICYEQMEVCLGGYSKYMDAGYELPLFGTKFLIKMQNLGIGWQRGRKKDKVGFRKISQNADGLCLVDGLLLKVWLWFLQQMKIDGIPSQSLYYHSCASCMSNMQKHATCPTCHFSGKPLIQGSVAELKQMLGHFHDEHRPLRYILNKICFGKIV